MSGSLTWTKIDWASNPSYPWHGLYNLRIDPWGHASMQENQWIIVFSIFGSTDSAGTVWKDWLIWTTATADASKNLTLTPLQYVDLTPYGNTLIPHGNGNTSWSHSMCVMPALSALGQHPSVDVVLVTQNTTLVTDINATSIYDAFLPLNVDLTTGAVTAHPVVTIDVYPFYFWNNSFFTGGHWESPGYTSYGNHKLKIEATVGIEIGRVDAIAGTCGPRHIMQTASGNDVFYYQNVGLPGQPVFLVPDMNQYFQFPDSSGDLLFSSLTMNSDYLNMQNSNFLPTTFPAAFGSGFGDNGSTVIWNAATFPETVFHGGYFKGYINGIDNPGTFNQGASSWAVPSGVYPIRSGSFLLMTRAPDNQIISGQLCLMGTMGQGSAATATEIYRLGHNGSDYSSYLVSSQSYPPINPYFQNVTAPGGFSDVNGNPCWMFHDTSVGGWQSTDWYLWAGAFVGGSKWSIGSLLLG